jgi:hypothetical protein
MDLPLNRDETSDRRGEMSSGMKLGVGYDSVQDGLRVGQEVIMRSAEGTLLWRDGDSSSRLPAEQTGGHPDEEHTSEDTPRVRSSCRRCGLPAPLPGRQCRK